VQTSPMPHERIVAIPLEIAVDHLIRQRKHDLELVRNTAAKLSAELQTRTAHGPDDQVAVLHDPSLALEELGQGTHQELRVLIRSAFEVPACGAPRRIVQGHLPAGSPGRRVHGRTIKAGRQRSRQPRARRQGTRTASPRRDGRARQTREPFRRPRCSVQCGVADGHAVRGSALDRHQRSGPALAAGGRV
jgi:hypothetical protein